MAKGGGGGGNQTFTGGGPPRPPGMPGAPGSMMGAVGAPGVASAQPAGGADPWSLAMAYSKASADRWGGGGKGKGAILSQLINMSKAGGTPGTPGTPERTVESITPGGGDQNAANPQAATRTTKVIPATPGTPATGGNPNARAALAYVMAMQGRNQQAGIGRGGGYDRGR